MAGMKGGMVLTNDEQCIERVRDLSRYDNRDGYKVRYNYSLTDIHAAIGKVQLRRLDDFVLARRRAAQQCARQLRYPNFFAGLT